MTLQESAQDESDADFGSDQSPIPFILPLILFMLFGMLAPSFDKVPPSTGEEVTAEQQIKIEEYTQERNRDKAVTYCALLAFQVAAGFGLLYFFRDPILSQFPFRFSVTLAILVGIVGCVLWVWIAKLGLEHSLLASIGMESWMPKRVGFNPNQLGSSQFVIFVACRFLVLAALVPVIEELFLRGWLIRFVENEKWWTVSLASLGLKACCVATLYGVLTHPGEIVAAIVWFSLVTVMMKRTGNFWDCVIAHAVTNFLLGVWVLNSGDWFLW